MNVYFHIDLAWSYQFLTRYKNIIANYDFFTFSDRFYTVAINTLIAHANYQLTKDSSDYHTTMTQIQCMCDDYPQLGAYLPHAFNSLKKAHVDALIAIPGKVIKYQPIIDDANLLTGVLFTVATLEPF